MFDLQIQLPVSSITLADALSQVIKAFQNPIWAEQARERLKEIKKLQEDSIQTKDT